MTAEMVEKARENAEKYGYKNIEFKLGISRCFLLKEILLSRNQQLRHKSGAGQGKSFPGNLASAETRRKNVCVGHRASQGTSRKIRKDKNLLSGCVAGALMRDEYIEKMKKAGFEVEILSEDKDIRGTSREYAER